jgi:hypothetical protein
VSSLRTCCSDAGDTAAALPLMCTARYRTALHTAREAGHPGSAARPAKAGRRGRTGRGVHGAAEALSGPLRLPESRSWRSCSAVCRSSMLQRVK